ncbi:MAG TPA: hypothetical protein PLI09_15870 [Candidatus Hydrogenedentes bacterium]|nr:hypothetical protein [Candidatus Hydrogenedentota bacterium]
MIILLLTLCLQADPVSVAPVSDVFTLQGDKNIMEEEHFGIINGLATIGVNYKDTMSISGFWSPPYVSSDFVLDVKLFGEKVSTNHYAWRPFEVTREGMIRDMEVKTQTTLIYGTRAGVLSISLHNPQQAAVDIPLEVTVHGTLDTVSFWEFSRAQSKTPAPAELLKNGLIKRQDKQAIVLQTDLDSFTWNAATSSGATLATLPAGASKTFHLVFAMGAADDTEAACQTITTDADKKLVEAGAEYERRVTMLFAKLPTLTSDNPALDAFYRRSLVHFITNRWETPEFVLHPYYSTGSMKGGCVCSYLWDYGELWEILPLYDPLAAREHITQFLKIDITQHFAFIPTTGEAFGPWYMVNQEKILGSIYYYVKNTGDTAFLNETVNDKTVLDWVLQNAMYGDDPAKPVQLIDYGSSNSHLELRRGFPYNHVMPDLNGRRYMNYLMGDALCTLMGKPAPYLKERTEALKKLLKQELWDSEHKWFLFKDETGKPDLRYTVQMFKLFNSPVLDEEETTGLLSHLNETEFLGEFGLQSMSKTDIAYDQVDIDNGGGGSCTCFPPQITERLYKSGHVLEADDILRRILWWGERMPYWGDSLVANSIDYRKDTPLQCAYDGVTVAQCVIFGLFGVDVAFNGDITFTPKPTGLSKHLALKGLQLRGNTFDIEISGAEYDVRCGEQRIHAAMPKAVVFLAQNKIFNIVD